MTDDFPRMPVPRHMRERLIAMVEQVGSTAEAADILDVPEASLAEMMAPGAVVGEDRATLFEVRLQAWEGVPDLTLEEHARLMLVVDDVLRRTQASRAVRRATWRALRDPERAASAVQALTTEVQHG